MFFCPGQFLPGPSRFLHLFQIFTIKKNGTYLQENFTIVLCIQYAPVNGKVESKLNFLYTIYRVEEENKILYIVVART